MAGIAPAKRSDSVVNPTGGCFIMQKTDPQKSCFIMNPPPQKSCFIMIPTNTGFIMNENDGFIMAPPKGTV